MRRFPLLFATLVVIVGLGAPAIAVDDAYPPRSLLVTVSDGSPEPGTPFDVTVTGCVADDVIEFVFGGDTASVPCAVASAITGSLDDAGAATQQFVAPGEGGVFSGTVLLASTDAEIGTFQIDVPTAVPASLTTSKPLVQELSWAPGMFSFAFVILIGVAVAAGIRTRLLAE
jgi:hypothetical protein